MSMKRNGKMTYTAAICALAMWTGTAALAAEIDPAKVTPLVAKLADPDGENRKAAADELFRMGPDVKAELRKAITDKTDRKVKARIESIVTRIDNAAPAASGGADGVKSVNLSGIPITLDLQDVDAADAFDALFAQAKGEYATQPSNLLADKDNLPPVTLKYDKAPFWAVLLDLCKQSGVALQQHGDGSKLTFTNNQNVAEWLARPAVVSNGFLIQATTVTLNRSVQLGRTGDPQESLAVQFYAYPEPSLRVIRSSYQLKPDEATDDDGNSLMPTQNFGDGWSSGRQSYWQIQMQLNAKAATGNKIVKLRGTAKFGVTTELAHLEVPNIADVKNFSKNLGTTTVTIKSMTKRGGGPNNEQYELAVNLKRNGGGDDGMFNIGPQGMVLLDAKGRELASQGWGGGGGGDGGYNYQMQFARYNRGGGEDSRPGPPDKLVWDVPTKIADVQVPFEFKDIQLP